MTYHSSDDVVFKISLQTLHLQTNNEIQHHGPENKCIQQDYHLAIKNMGTVYRNDGKLVPRLADRNTWGVDKEDTMKWGRGVANEEGLS